MTENTMNLLADTGKVNAYGEYSGRGMYGETCHAVSYEGDKNLLQAVASVAYVLGQDAEDADARKEWDDLKEDLKSMRFDNLGLGMIAY